MGHADCRVQKYLCPEQQFPGFLIDGTTTQACRRFVEGKARWAIKEHVDILDRHQGTAVKDEEKRYRTNCANWRTVEVEENA